MLLVININWLNYNKHEILIHIFINVNPLLLKVSGKETQKYGIPQCGNEVPGKWKWVLKTAIPEKPVDGFHCHGKAVQFRDVLLQ